MSKDNDEVKAEEVTVSSDNDEESSGRMSSVRYGELCRIQFIEFISFKFNNS